MLSERDLDLIQVELDNYLMKIVEEYYRGWLGDRAGLPVEVEEDGNEIYGQEGRQVIPDSGQVRGNDQGYITS